MNYRKYRLFLYGLMLSACFVLASCFKDEPLNAECDILQGHIKYSPELFESQVDTVFYLTNTTAKCYVRSGADCSHLAPVFQITEGAKISPESGSVQDFSKGSVRYTLTSQDGNWSKVYEVTVDSIHPSVSYFDFENYNIDREYSKFYEFYDVDQTGHKHYEWSSGNKGFMLSRGSATPEEYPTSVTDDAHSGQHAALMITRDVGAFGAMVNRRLAAGNLYLGSFDISLALTNTMKAARFGVTYDKKPVIFRGYYKYKQGDNFQDKQGVIHPERVDSAAIYAVLYENTDARGNIVCLYGDNVKTSPLIVAIADMDFVAPTTAWTEFSLPFEYRKTLDEEKLANHGYNLAIVCSSSKGGADYEGAIGSTLIIDDLKIE